MNVQVLERLKNSAAIPSMPQVVARFLQIMQDPGFDYADVVKVLSTDAGTVSEILRLANSALFGVRHKVASLRQALTLLGPKRTRSLVLGRYLVESMGQQSPDGLDMSYYWRRSLTASVVASRLADRVIPQHRDEVFIAALLADIGLVILCHDMPEAYSPIVARFAPKGFPITPEEEMDAAGVTHAEVSAMILDHWSLPKLVSDAVNLHQSQNPGNDDTARVARLLNSADRISKMLCELPEGEAIAETCINAMGFVGVDTAVLVELLPRVEQDIEELADVLRIDVIPSKVYALIAKTIQEKLSSPAGAP